MLDRNIVIMKNTPAKNLFALVVKRDCPTCALLEPVVAALVDRYGERLRVYVQDDPGFLSSVVSVVDDTELEFSYRQNVEIVPALIRFDEGQKEAQKSSQQTGQREVGRVYGWDRGEWRGFTGIDDLGEGLVEFRPGCGSLSCEPGVGERLALRYGEGFRSRRVEVGEAEDEMEVCFERGWSDGLPVVPPTEIRVMRMLGGIGREAGEIVGRVPPDNVECSVEKVAVNAVLAGCKPEYMPLVLAAVEAALDDRFCLHGLLCTTYFSGPVMVVNGPVARRLGMNSGVNALGQGNRANATISRALQLVVRNVGGGVPGGIDRATLGNPGKYTYCFAEDESDEAWHSLAQDQGFGRDDSTVSLFAGEGLQGIIDQQSRNPQSLARSMAASLRSVAHSKLFGMADAVLVVSPEHRRVFLDAGWSKQTLQDALREHLQAPGSELLRGVGGIDEGMPDIVKDKTLNKFRPGGLHIVTAGGSAGLFSAIIGGWVASGEKGSQLVTRKL